MDTKALEIKTVLWQTLFSSTLFAFLIVASLELVAAAFLPAALAGVLLSIVCRDANHLSILGRILSFVFGVFIFCPGCYLWWATLKYFVRADAEGISQSNGFRSQSVRWSDVACYTLDQNQGTVQRQIEPVMYDSSGKVIFRPMAHVLVSSAKGDKRRREFWQFVETKLQGKLTTG